MNPKLVVMLTHHDRTVANALEVFESAKNAKAVHWGFKEVGIPLVEMKELVRRMKAAGKETYLEIVAYTEEECLAGAQMGVEIEIGTVMGTLYFPSISRLLKEHGVCYMPFVGQLEGRPTVLKGTIEEIVKHGRFIKKQDWVHGIDLLGYRFVGDAPALNRRFVKAMGSLPVCIAGSINDFARLDEVIACKADSFTIGGAFFEEKFGKGKTFGEQIDIVVDYVNR
jgi:hypothetical protein